eukprot:9291657-Lingulodinium_polyedra.AAC.1
MGATVPVTLWRMDPHDNVTLCDGVDDLRSSMSFNGCCPVFSNLCSMLMGLPGLADVNVGSSLA